MSTSNTGDTSAGGVLMKMPNKQLGSMSVILRWMHENYIEAAIISVNTQLHRACTPRLRRNT